MTASGSRQSAAVTRVPTSTTSAALVGGGGKSSRYVFNDSTGKLYVRYGTGPASATDFTLLIPTQTGAVIEGYGGSVTGILDTGTGNAQVTEW